MKNITIYHNPRCSKSRKTLALIEQHNITPTIVPYLEQPISKSGLKELLSKLAMSPKELLRKNEALYKTLNLDHADHTQDALIDIMVKNPKLIERPIVTNGTKAILGRPPENVLELIN